MRRNRHGSVDFAGNLFIPHHPHPSSRFRQIPQLLACIVLSSPQHSALHSILQVGTLTRFSPSSGLVEAVTSIYLHTLILRPWGLPFFLLLILSTVLLPPFHRSIPVVSSLNLPTQKFPYFSIPLISLPVPTQTSRWCTHANVPLQKTLSHPSSRG